MKTSLAHLTKGLNEPQSKAVIHPNTSLAVIAGAGSGKTRVLTHRIAYLMSSHQWSPDNILAVTFTNKAAQEMKNRLGGLGVGGLDRMWVGTFHGLANRFLRRHHQAANLAPHFQILDAQEQDKVIKKLFKAQDWNTEEHDPKDVARFINAQKDAGRRPPQCPTDTSEEAWLRHAYMLYQDMCDTQSWVDFGELLLRCYEVTASDESIRLRYQNQFKHILVDEFQDTNDIQYQWIAMLSSLGQSVPVTVVGDMDQSIYSWRGAKMTNVQKFAQEFAGVTMIKLEQNYRSTHHILASANAIINNNLQRIPKNLWTSDTSGEPVVLFEAYNEKDEADWAITQALVQHKKSGRWSDTAVLYRSNAMSRIVEEACIKRGLPYKIHGGIRFFERAEIKDAMAHLTMLVDKNNDLMLERALGAPAKGFGAKTLETLRVEGIRQNKTWAQLLSDPAFIKTHLSPKVGTTWSDLVKQWEAAASQGTLEDKIRWCVEKTGLLAHYQQQDRKEGTDKADNLSELLSVGHRYTKGIQATGTSVVSDFLAAAALESEGSNSNDGDAINLMTIHASKGLEFPTVCAIGWDDGIFPSSQSLSDLDRLEEERRLAYVAITRAEQRLCISGAAERWQYGQRMHLSPSRFLKELPASSSFWARSPTRAVVQHTAPIAAGPAPSLPQANQSRAQAYWKVGDKVSHPTFGAGDIVRVDGLQKNDRVLVRFEDGSRKLLLPQLAKLSKI